MLEHDELRRLRAALRNSEQGAHAELFHLLTPEHLHFHAITLREITCLLRQITWSADIRRQVTEVLGERHTFSERIAVIEAELRLLEICLACDRQHNLLQRIILLLAPAF